MKVEKIAGSEMYGEERYLYSISIGPVEEERIDKIIQNLKNNKSLDSTKITAEMLKARTYV